MQRVLRRGDAAHRVGNRTQGLGLAGSDALDGLQHAAVEEITDAGDAVVVKLAGELDLYNAHAVREALTQQAARKPPRLVVDLGNVTFIDSTGLGVLIEARSRLENPAAFMLAAPGLEVRRALEVSGLDRHFPVHASVDEALAAELAG
jgi:anti-sigma B factor antagonist